MIKYFARLKSRKGFTLTELIVVTVLIGIIMACVAAFAGPVRTMMRGANARSESNTINKIIGDYIERRLAYADYISIYAGISYKNGETDAMYTSAKESFEKLKERAKQTKDGKMTNTPGILYFHYEDGGTGGDELKHTFRIYDMPVEFDTDVPDTAAAFCSALMALTDPSDSKSDPLYTVFNKEFYGNYQFLITMGQLGVRENTLKQRANLSFGITSYEFRGDTLDASGEGTSFVEDDVKNYYKYMNKVATVTEDPMDKYISERTGVENISFALENISKASSVNLMQGTSSIYGTDLIVFYNVRTYNIAKDS